MFENIGKLFEQYYFYISANNIIAFFLIIFITLILRKLALYL